MLTHAELKARALSDPSVRAEYDALEDEYALASILLNAREAAGLTQAEVATRMQTKAPAIARLEAGGKHSPSISTLRRYAAAVGCTLEIKLTPRP
ncbi:helix-turn-helix domain-containing protein [Burkholderiaceae bacterium DAT-1]|nr:helix-turn-helix domain-containing protein [Burkholderiaceae bacterium DAT-1]